MDLMAPNKLVVVVPAAVAVIASLVVVAVAWKLAALSLRSRIAGAPVTIVQLLAMQLRRVDPVVVVNARVIAAHAGLDLATSDLELHALAGGDVGRVVNALVAAKQAGVNLTWVEATALDLMGRDVLAEVRQRSEAVAARQ